MKEDNNQKLLFLFIIGHSVCFNHGLSRPHLLFRRYIVSWDLNLFLNIHFYYMFVPFSSSFHPRSNWLDTARFSDFLASYSSNFCFFPTIFLSTLILFYSNNCLYFFLRSCFWWTCHNQAYGCLIYFLFIFFPHIFFV